MALPLSITFTLIISYIAFFMKKEFSFVHNSIVFMVMAITTKNYNTIMAMQLKWLKNTEDPFLFPFLLIHREIIIPLIIVIFLNLYQTAWSKKILLFVIIMGFLLMMDALSRYFGVVEFVSWNMFLSMLENSSYLMIGLGASQLLLLISKREELHHDRHL